MGFVRFGSGLIEVVMKHLIKFSDPVFTNLISNNIDKRVYTLEILKKMKEIFLKINTGMQINGGRGAEC